MARDKELYSRKLSAEEARDEYIMIMKNGLSMFPNPGKPFTLKVGKKKFDSTVDAVECWCMGPQKPHRHFRIDAAPFRDAITWHRGTSITIKKTGDDTFVVSA